MQGITFQLQLFQGGIEDFLDSLFCSLNMVRNVIGPQQFPMFDDIIYYLMTE